VRNLLAVALLLSTCATAAEKDASVAGTYSNLYYNEEGGDLLGLEIIIRRQGGDYRAGVQVAEGEPLPIVTVPVRVRGRQIEFTVPKPAEAAGHYAGSITDAGLLLSEGSEKASWIERIPRKPYLLKRKCSYWIKCPISPRSAR
jgi:hypothetical protein